MVYGLWFMVYGLWFMVHGLWFIFNGLWFMDYGLWFIGLWFIVYGLWFMVYGLLVYWFMVYGLPCPGVVFEQRLQGRIGIKLVIVKYSSTDFRDVRESDLAAHETVDGLFLGRVEHGAGSTSLPGNLVPQR